MFRVIGQPNLNYVVDRQAAARVTVSMSVTYKTPSKPRWEGGAVSQVLQGEQRYDLVARYQKPYRDTQRSHRRHSSARAFRRKSLSGAVDPGEGGGWR